MTMLIAHVMPLLAQAAPPPPPPPPAGGAGDAGAAAAAEGAAEVVPPPDPAWYQPFLDALLQSPFLILILFIFVTAIITVLFQQRKRDKCLKLFNDYHVSFLSIAGRAIWGDLVVFSQGIELEFDAPYRTSRGLLKTGQMIYENEMANCLALCRTVDGLTDKERKHRRKQAKRRFRPNIFWRTLRWIRNTFNTLRDAFNNAFTQVIGQLAKAKPGSVIATQQSQVSSIGTTLLGAAGNSYEPILERHIGKPVILELASPNAPDKAIIEIPGYLAEYSDKYVAVFNMDHTPTKEFDLTPEEGDHPGEGYSLSVTPKAVVIGCTGPDVLHIKTLDCGPCAYNLNIAITNGTSVKLRREPGPVAVKMALTRKVDVVAPRAQATIHFAGFDEADHAEESREARRTAHREGGLSPDAETEELDGDAAIQPPLPVGAELAEQQNPSVPGKSAAGDGGGSGASG